MSDGTDSKGGGDGFREFLRAVQELLDRGAQAIAAVQPVIDRWVTEASRALMPAREWLQVNGPKVAEVMLALQRVSAEAHVENWADLDEGEWIAALDLMRADDGVPIAWLPPGAVVKELLAAADHDARNDVLLARAEEIAADARRVLADVTHPELAGLKAAVASAWDAWDAGLTLPVQALAGAAVGAILDEHLGFEKFSDFRISWEEYRATHPEEWRLTALRVTAVMCSLSTAVQREDQGPFSGFNRHETLHGLNPKQYTPVNALRALMLVTSAARELQFAVADEWMSSTRFTPPHPRAIPPQLPPTPDGDHGEGDERDNGDGDDGKGGGGSAD